MKFKNLKLLSAFLVGHPTAVADEPLLEVFGEVLTLNHEIKQAPRRSLPSLKEGADLDEEENLHDLQGYYLHSTITFRIGLVNGETDENSELTLRVWDPAWRKFPGWNPPFVEIFKNGKRVSGQLLKEVGMVDDVWAAQHRGVCYLYVHTRHRHRQAKGTNVYRLNEAHNSFSHAGLHFSKEELARETK